MFKFITIALSLTFGALAQFQPVRFHGYPIAQSSISSSGTILYSNPSGSMSKGAQFLYDKLISNSTLAGLVTVYLCDSNNEVATLQTDFSAINQECSCYYLDAQDLQTRFPFLQSRSDYSISFKGPNYQAESGVFTLDFGYYASQQSNFNSNSQFSNNAAFNNYAGSNNYNNNYAGSNNYGSNNIVYNNVGSNNVGYNNVGSNNVGYNNGGSNNYVSYQVPAQRSY